MVAPSRTSSPKHIARQREATCHPVAIDTIVVIHLPAVVCSPSVLMLYNGDKLAVGAQGVQHVEPTFPCRELRRRMRFNSLELSVTG
jgi:hypothetical protein